MYQTQGQSQELRQVTSAHLAQMMTMLYMSSDEIREKVEDELSKNPALELVDERICPTCKRKLPPDGKCPYCSSPKAENKDESIVFVSPRDDFSSTCFQGHTEPFRDEPEFDSAQQDDLPTYVLRQIGPDLQEDQKMIAAYLLTSLDEDGFITSSILEIAQYYHVLPSKVEEVIAMIQKADPIGVGTKNPQEAMLVQIDHLSEISTIPPHTKEIVKESYDELMRGHYKELAKKYGLPVKQIQMIEHFVGENLNPYPARAHWGEKNVNISNNEISAYHYPDILIYYLNDNPENQLVVEIIMPINGYLQVNPVFKKEAKKAPEEKAEEWKSDIDKASLLVKCLYQRNNTMVQLMEKLVQLQSEFIRHGDGSIIPITRAQIASDLGVHESTISRAVSNKTVMLPNHKVIPLSAFFDRSLNVRTIIKDMVKEESKPLTDAKIVDALQQMGFDVARRTVAKYRAMEGILPAHLRHSTTAR